MPISPFPAPGSRSPSESRLLWVAAFTFLYLVVPLHPMHAVECLSPPLSVGPEHAVSNNTLGPELDRGAVQPSVASDGNGYYVAWFGVAHWPYVVGTVAGATVGSDGTARTPRRSLESGTKPDVAWNGSHYLVAMTSASCSRFQPCRGGIYGYLLDASGDPAGARIEISQESSTYSPVSVTAAGDLFLVSWQGSASNPFGIFGALIDGEGVVVDQFQLSAEGQAPVVGVDQHGLVVAWIDGSSIKARRSASTEQPKAWSH